MHKTIIFVSCHDIFSDFMSYVINEWFQKLPVNKRDVVDGMFCLFLARCLMTSIRLNELLCHDNDYGGLPNTHYRGELTETGFPDQQNLNKNLTSQHLTNDF